jgi:dual-specificity kinase
VSDLVPGQDDASQAGSKLFAIFKDKIIRLLGQGTFGKVVEAVSATDRYNKVAIKIIRAVPKYREASAIEIRVLKALKEHDPVNEL